MDYFTDFKDVLNSMVDHDLSDLKKHTNYFSLRAQPSQIRQNLEYLLFNILS